MWQQHEKNSSDQLSSKFYSMISACHNRYDVTEEKPHIVGSYK